MRGIGGWMRIRRGEWFLLLILLFFIFTKCLLSPKADAHVISCECPHRKADLGHLLSTRYKADIQVINERPAPVFVILNDVITYSNQLLKNTIHN